MSRRATASKTLLASDYASVDAKRWPTWFHRAVPTYPKVSPSQFHERDDLPDWRVLQRRIEAGFRAPSLAAGAAFIVRVIAAADAADHHPDVDLRYPGRLRVALTTHAQHGLTDADVDLAREISRLAAEDGLTTYPMLAQGTEVAIDALDIEAIRPFWRAVLGYVDEAPAAENQPVDAIVDPRRVGPSFWFQQMEEPRPQRSRMHIDVIVPHDEAEARVAAAIAAGGRLLTDQYARSFWVLADIEGNEACVCTWQDRE